MFLFLPPNLQLEKKDMRRPSVDGTFLIPKGSNSFLYRWVYRDIHCFFKQYFPHSCKLQLFFLFGHLDLLLWILIFFHPFLSFLLLRLFAFSPLTIYKSSWHNVDISPLLMHENKFWTFNENLWVLFIPFSHVDFYLCILKTSLFYLY